MRENYNIVNRIKKRILVVFIMLCLIIFGFGSVFFMKNVNAGGGWTAGGSSYVKKLVPVHGSGATAWIIGSAFLLQPYTSYTDAKTGLNIRSNMIKEFDAAVPRYTEGTVAIIPYNETEHLVKHGYNTIAVIKRPSKNSTSILARRDKEHLASVLRMKDNITKINSSFKNGVFYKDLTTMMKDKTDINDLKNLDYIMKQIKKDKKERMEQSQEVWSYITRFDEDKRRYHIDQRIDQYLQIEQIGIKDPNDLTKLSKEQEIEFRLRYIDFLLTVYCQCDDSVAAPYWEKAINEYIKGTAPKGKNQSNIMISQGYVARGENKKEDYENIIGGCNDFLDMTIDTQSIYSLGSLDSANTVEEKLEKQNHTKGYYNRLLESIRLSLVYQKKNHIKTDRTYTSAGLWGSNIASRIVQNKPIINGTKVSYNMSNSWSDQNIIENIYLKEYFHGAMLVPAYLPPVEPDYIATLNINSMKPKYKTNDKVKILSNEPVINDNPLLTIYLDGQNKKDQWNKIFTTNSFYNIQVSFTRTPISPIILMKPEKYIIKVDSIDKEVLKSILLKGEKFYQWNDDSLMPVPIEESESKKYTYQATVTIYYSNKKVALKEMKKVPATTNEAVIIYKKFKPDLLIETASYVSEPDAYSELKEGSIYNETFEAMAGVPTTRNLYFASGGSEFMVEVEVMRDKDKKAERKYRSYFAGTDCEFKQGDTAPNQSLGGQSVSLHGGGTYSKTWTGSIPNNGTSKTGLHTATSIAVPDYSAYNGAKAEATAFAAQVNSTTLSFTSASDKKTRSFHDWGANISGDSKNPPQNVTVTVNCAHKAEVSHKDNKGNKIIDSPEVPCGNEQATANPGGPGSYSITVTWSVPAHVLCGPCCEHVLKPVEDTWTQKSSFDTLKITDVRVWKIDSSYVGGMEEITYDENPFVKATIKQGDPNIFYNIAPTDTSQDGRLRYSLQQQQHDWVTWYETNQSGSEKRSNKCDGLSGTSCGQNPIPVVTNQGHTNPWAKGILYNNTGYPNGVDYHATTAGTKSTVTNNSTDGVDKATEEYQRFHARRNQNNKMTVISDMLILQTSSGDQSVLYFDTTQTKKAQENFDNIEVSMEQMWNNNSKSAFHWKADSINIGSYNGQYDQTQTKYKGTGNQGRIETAFDQDLLKIAAGDELGKARVVSSKSFTSGANHQSSPSAGQARMPRPSELRMVMNDIMQNPINTNQEYFTEQSFVYYKPILSKTSEHSTGIAKSHEEDSTTNDMDDYGYTIKSRYRATDGKEGNVNSIVVLNPVSAQEARMVSLPQDRDQRTTIPEGSANDLLEKIAASQVCPLSPALCEYRVLNCNYYSEVVKSSFDFEKINTVKLAEDSDTKTDTNTAETSGTEDNTSDQFVFEKFETNQYGIHAVKNCTVSTSKERLVVKVTGKDAIIELPVEFYSSNVVAAKLYFGTAGSSQTSRMYWEGTKNSSSIETTIQSDTINQTMDFALGTWNPWKQAGKLSNIRFQLDGDNTGSGVYIISKIEFLQQGNEGTENASYTGSTDDKSIIRSLIKTSAGVTMDYELPAGCSISENEGQFQGFETGRFLNMNGKQISMDLTEIGISYDKNTRIKVEANLYLPSVSSKDRMLFAFDGLGFYVPAGQTYGVFTTGNGVEKKAVYDIVGIKTKVGAVFSYGDIEDCELYINGKKITDYVTKNPTKESIKEEDIGTSIQIGSWKKDEKYATGFYIDNLTITKMPGSSTHTASCYTTYKEHSYTKQYTCNSKLDFNHVHNSSCTYTISQNNTHVHTADCFQLDLDSLKIAYDKVANGDASLLKSMLGDALFTELEVGEASGNNSVEQYYCTGGMQTFTAPTTSDYTFELYGAQGGGGVGGTGGYTKGTLRITKGTTVYFNLGGMNSYNGGGYGAYSTGGGATDVRIGTTSLYNRVLVAGGGGGSGPAQGGAGGGLVGGTGLQRCGSPGGGGSQISGGYGGSNNGSSGSLGQGGHVTGGTGAGGGGGGYYGGGSGGNDSPSYQDNDDSGGGGGSGFIGGILGYPVTDGSTSQSTHTGDGTLTVSWASSKSFEEVQKFVEDNKNRVPVTIGSNMNPIFQCNGLYNKHVCDANCKDLKILNCNEPHHSGQHYDYDNDICWDACGNDHNHKSSVQAPIKDKQGKSVKNGTFINLDNYFQVYYPNVGDFKGTGEYGIAQTSINRGKGYTDQMSTLEWTREKKVQFGFDVLFNRNGVWEQHMAGEWIVVPIYDSLGRELTYYDFYCLLSNTEEIGASVEFCVEAINCIPSPGEKEDPYLGDEECNADCVFDSTNACITNKERFSSLESYHSAYRMTYTDVVGRIGNLILEDTQDMRFSNLLKESTSADKWMIEGVLHEVDSSISKSYLAWFHQDGSFGNDIRGVKVSKETQMYNTYGTQKWTNQAKALSLPVEGDKNIIPSLKKEQLKPGYNILFDVSTIGEYRSKVQVVPYFYALNTDTDTLTPIDIHIKMDGGYKPINYFGLMSEYVTADNGYSEEYYQLKDKLYPYIMNLDWKKESLRRNYTTEEETITKFMGMNQRENVTDSSGNVLTSKYLTIPYGEHYALGTVQMLLPDTRARTFIGSSTVNAVNINGGTQTNLNGNTEDTSFWNNGQRWHLSLGIPSSAVYVPYRNHQHLEPTENITHWDGTKCKAYEEIEKGNYVIVMTADIKSIGDKYVLGYSQGKNNGTIKVNGKTYVFGEDIPTVLALYDAKQNASQDVDFVGTH